MRTHLSAENHIRILLIWNKVWGNSLKFSLFKSRCVQLAWFQELLCTKHMSQVIFHYTDPLVLCTQVKKHKENKGYSSKKWNGLSGRILYSSHSVWEHLFFLLVNLSSLITIRAYSIGWDRTDRISTCANCHSVHICSS